MEPLMHTQLFYFTGTGNSLALARQIASKLGDTEIIAAGQALKNDAPIHGQRIGLIFPVYMYRVPHLMARLIKKIKQAEYVFAVANNAGDAGRALAQTRKILKMNQLKLNAGIQIIMPSNYIPWGGAIPEKDQQDLFQQASKKIEALVEAVQLKKPFLDASFSFLKTYFLPGVLYWLGYEFIAKQDRSFWATDQCTRCGICAKICPAGNITYPGQAKPQWNHRCEMCLACLQWCPTQAIEWGKKTAQKKRYQHPEITLNDMLGLN